MKKYIIAIDGPGASGKSTTAKKLAKKLMYTYIDTGAMYRACALQTLNNNISLANTAALVAMLANIDIKINYSHAGNQIFLQNKNVTKRIREEDISRLASEIAVIEIVRTKMVDLQRRMGEIGGVILDGRDIGTVVFPHADYKFFITADVKIRAYRRWKELQEKGTYCTVEEVEKELVWRDKNDSERAISPLRQADDAIFVDTSKLNIDEQVSHLLSIIT